ncbi:MAG: sigma-54-dependent Fis family transcriptional regulator [bacterium]
MTTPTKLKEEAAPSWRKKFSDLHKSDMDSGNGRFFEKLIRSFPGVFYLIDHDLRFLSWNENLERVTGYCGEEIGRMHGPDLFDEEGIKSVLQGIQETLAEGESIVEAELLAKDGTRTPYIFTGVKATIDDTSYVIGIGIDLSELKEKETALAESEGFYRMLAGRMTEGVVLYGDSKVLFANPAFMSMFEFREPSELIEKEIGESLSKRIEICFRQMFEGLVKGIYKERSFESPCVTRSGREIWIEGQASLLRWKKHPAVFLTTRDITDCKRREMLMNEEAAHLRRENVTLRSSIKDRYRLGKIIGKSAAMQEVYEAILNAAATSANVVIYGESGTGKELVARAIHEMGSRSTKAFVPVNCAAIPENLLESEFFGHKKGSFTGAHADKKGYLDLADGGTLFLDEVGELSLGLQAKLLRAIDGGGYSPVGSNATKLSDFRVIAATNKDLSEQMKKGLLRHDFFYRIHVIPINLPPLKNRREDIPLLLEHFLKIYSKDGKVPPVPGHVLEALLNYDWPGNVRELQNAVQRYLAVGHIEFIPTPLPRSKRSAEARTEKTDAAQKKFSLSKQLLDAERVAILKALDHCQGKKTTAAKALGISRKTLFRKMTQLGLG